MNKKITLVAAFALIFSLFAGTVFAADPVAKIGAQTYPTIQDAIDAASPGAVVELLTDVNLGDGTVSINKGITLSGGASQYAITSAATTRALLIQSIGSGSSDVVVLENLQIDATSGNGVDVQSPQSTTLDLTISNCTINTKICAINFLSTSDGHFVNLTVEDSVLSSTDGITNYDQQLAAGGQACRGVSMRDMVGAQVAIQNSTIQGFFYAVNAAASVTPPPNRSMTVDITDSTVKARAAVNSWMPNSTWNLTNTAVLGINIFASAQEQFACVVINSEAPYDAANNVVNINGCRFSNYFNSTGMNNPNAIQGMVATVTASARITIDQNPTNGNTVFESVSVTKGTPVLYADTTDASAVTFYGGQYNADVSKFVASGRAELIKSDPNNTTPFVVGAFTPQSAAAAGATAGTTINSTPVYFESLDMAVTNPNVTTVQAMGNATLAQAVPGGVLLTVPAGATLTASVDLPAAQVTVNSGATIVIPTGVTIMVGGVQYGAGTYTATANNVLTKKTTPPIPAKANPSTGVCF